MAAMGFTKVADGVYLVPMGAANAVLFDVGQELVLVDAGLPHQADRVLDAVGKLGRAARDLRHIVLTHGHPDHLGSAAALVRATGARTYMHAADAPLAEGGGPFRPMTPAPGPMRHVAFHVVWAPNKPAEPVRIDRHVADGETLPFAGGLQVIHAPGHCAGHVALLGRHGRLLVCGDAFSNVLGLGDPVGFEDVAEGRRSQHKLAGLPVEAAVFGHGKPLVRDAAARLRRAAAKLSRD